MEHLDPLFLELSLKFRMQGSGILTICQLLAARVAASKNLRRSVGRIGEDRH